MITEAAKADRVRDDVGNVRAGMRVIVCVAQRAWAARPAARVGRTSRSARGPHVPQRAWAARPAAREALC